jgi:hypothetical protein
MTLHVEVADQPRTALQDVQTHRRQEFLDILNSLESQGHYFVEPIFEVLRAWQQEYGEPKELVEAACQKLSLDPVVGAIYLKCPGLILPMEHLRRGVPVQRVKVVLAMSEEARRWWYALLVVRVLLKCDGVVSHARLLRWLGHRADRLRIRDAVDLLCEAKLVETYQVKGRDPFRPVMWHRFKLVISAVTTTSDAGLTR